MATSIQQLSEKNRALRMAAAQSGMDSMKITGPLKLNEEMHTRMLEFMAHAVKVGGPKYAIVFGYGGPLRDEAEGLHWPDFVLGVLAVSAKSEKHTREFMADIAQRGCAGTADGTWPTTLWSVDFGSAFPVPPTLKTGATVTSHDDAINEYLGKDIEASRAADAMMQSFEDAKRREKREKDEIKEKE